MTRQVLDLTGLAGEGWRGAVHIDAALIEGGGTAYLRRIRRIGDSLQVRLAATETDNPDDAGPEFTEAFEGAARALTFVSDTGVTITLKGPGHADNVFVDATEPYFWTPDNGAAMGQWFDLSSGAFALILDDGVVPTIPVHGTASAGAAQAHATVGRHAQHQVRGAAQAGGAEASATVHSMPVRTTRGTASAGGAEASARVDVLPALTLADFDTDGLELDALALIRAGASGDGTIFATPPRGSVGTLLDGELGLGAGEAAITRIRRRNGTMLAVNDDDPLSLTEYFGPGGAGADLTLCVQTAAGVASLPVTAHGRGGSSFIQFGPIGTELDAILDGIGDGDRFIFAFARPAVTALALRGTASAGAPEAAATLARITPAVHPIRSQTETGAPEACARVVRVSRAVRTIRGGAEAGMPEAAARLRAIRPVRGTAAAGDALARVRLRRVGRLPLRGRAASGPPEALAHVRRVPPAAEQYARAIRESAPEGRLLTALEIRHPAVTDPVRVVNDTIEHTIEGNCYVALRFDARLADDVDGQSPQAELAIDNVGRALTRWIEATGGGVGATVRVMQMLDIDDPPVEWEVTLDVAGMAVDQQRVTARLGFDPLLGRSAVTLRHDPQTSPGLF